MGSTRFSPKVFPNIVPPKSPQKGFPKFRRPRCSPKVGPTTVFPQCSALWFPTIVVPQEVSGAPKCHTGGPQSVSAKGIPQVWSPKGIPPWGDPASVFPNSVQVGPPMRPPNLFPKGGLQAVYRSRSAMASPTGYPQGGPTKRSHKGVLQVCCTSGPPKCSSRVSDSKFPQVVSSSVFHKWIPLLWSSVWVPQECPVRFPHFVSPKRVPILWPQCFLDSGPPTPFL